MSYTLVASVHFVTREVVPAQKAFVIAFVSVLAAVKHATTEHAAAHVALMNVAAPATVQQNQDINNILRPITMFKLKDRAG
jgi:hypothetical protein